MGKRGVHLGGWRVGCTPCTTGRTLLMVGLAILGTGRVVFALPINHIVISEIQIGGATATDEFVELYNPTTSPINISGWRLLRNTMTGGTTDNLVTSFGSFTIQPGGYFLVVHPV